jgi:hypothetical protein
MDLRVKKAALHSVHLSSLRGDLAQATARRGKQRESHIFIHQMMWVVTSQMLLAQSRLQCLSIQEE